MKDYLTYLGDGLYAKYENGMIALMANSPHTPSDTVYLEGSTYASLVKFVEKLRTPPKEENKS